MVNPSTCSFNAGPPCFNPQVRAAPQAHFIHRKLPKTSVQTMFNTVQALVKALPTQGPKAQSQTLMMKQQQYLTPSCQFKDPLPPQSPVISTQGDEDPASASAQSSSGADTDSSSSASSGSSSAKGSTSPKGSGSSSSKESKGSSSSSSRSSRSKESAISRKSKHSAISKATTARARSDETHEWGPFLIAWQDSTSNTAPGWRVSCPWHTFIGEQRCITFFRVEGALCVREP